MTTETATELIGLDTIAELAAQLRVDSIRSSTSAGSGHPTSSMSAADLIAVLGRVTCATTGTIHRRRSTTISFSPRVTPRPFFTRCSRRSGW